MPKLQLNNLGTIQKEQENELRRRRRDTLKEDETINIKGLSKSFIKYKAGIRDLTDEELNFHDFVHSAIKRREENRQKQIRQRKEAAVIAEKLKKQQQ